MIINKELVFKKNKRKISYSAKKMESYWESELFIQWNKVQRKSMTRNHMDTRKLTTKKETNEIIETVAIH